MTSARSSLRIVNGGEIPYRDAWQLQERMHASVVAGGPSLLFFCSHPHVLSLGSQTKSEHLLLSHQEYQKAGAEVVKTNRGGDVTYHGPGQLVAYPIFRLQDFPCGEDLHRFLRDLEELLIGLADHFGLAASRKVGKTGVWVGDQKLAAIGLRASRWVTMHGLALNNDCDLSWFQKIVPCGLSEGVTSLADKGVSVSAHDLQVLLAQRFIDYSGMEPVESSLREIQG